jgi:hypothetical protein
MPKRSLPKLILSFIILGTLLGTLVGILLFYITSLAYYGILGILFHALAGAILGMVNGLTLGFINLYISVQNPKQRCWVMLVSCGILSFISGTILYTLIYYPLTRSMGFALIIGGLFATMASFICIFAVRHVILEL